MANDTSTYLLAVENSQNIACRGRIETLPIGESMQLGWGSDVPDDESDDLEFADAVKQRQKCCACCWVIDELLHHKKKGTEVALRLDPETLPLPPWAVDMLLEGHLHTALCLGIYFTPQQGGFKNKKLPEEGSSVHIRGAYNVDAEEVSYLGYVGETFASCAFWQGLDESGRTLIYVNMNALTPAGILSLYNSSYIRTSGEMWNGLEFEILDFTNQCLQDLWESHGLREHLFGTDGLVWQYPSARFIFTGYSHGTPMSQGLAMLFILERERLRHLGQLRASAPEAYVIAWNGYRWTRESGQELIDKYLGDQVVILVSVRRYKGHAYFDPTSGYPEDGANSHHLYAIDIDDSLIEKLSMAPNTSRATAPMLSLEWGAMHSIHIKAVRRLTAVYDEDYEEAEEAVSEI